MMKDKSKKKERSMEDLRFEGLSQDMEEFKEDLRALESHLPEMLDAAKVAGARRLLSLEKRIARLEKEKREMVEARKVMFSMIWGLEDRAMSTKMREWMRDQDIAHPRGLMEAEVRLDKKPRRFEAESMHD